MFTNGSEWRKWDLHVHTPESVLFNNFNCDWDEYVKTLLRAAIDKDITAIGITDYFSIDGYKKLRRDYLDQEEVMASLFTSDELTAIKKILIFPNIEFRLKAFISTNSKELSSLNRKLNFHVLISNEVPTDEIESNFLHRIEFDFSANLSTGTEKRSLTKSNLIELGRKLKREHPNFSGQSDIFIGMLNAAVDEQEIGQILRKSETFRGRHLIALNPDEDLSKVGWNSQGHLARKNLIKNCHFMFSSNPSTIKFMLGEMHADRESFTNEFEKTKACLWGSDAHDFSSLFEPNENRYTWIKAEASFEGLKQVIYDPESRAKIQEHSPDKKLSYQTISRVRYIDERAPQEFSDSWVPISKDLTTIIGGKSSGKSMLLYLIAATVNNQEASSKCRLANASQYEGITSNPNFDFEVVWSNNEKSRLKDTDSRKPITYIPQLYINHLAENDGRSHLNLLIEEILSQNHEFKDHLDSNEARRFEIKSLIENHINAFFLLRRNNDSCLDEINKIGDKKAINLEIEKLKQEIIELRIKSGFTEIEEKAYRKLTYRKSTIERRKITLENFNKVSLGIGNLIKKRSSTIAESLRRSASAEMPLDRDSAFVDSIFDVLNKEITKASDETNKYISERTKKLPLEIQRIETELQKILKDLLPLNGKVKDKIKLEESQKKLVAEEAKTRKISEIEQKINQIKTQGKETFLAIAEAYSHLLQTYKDTVNELENPKYGLVGDLMIAAKIRLKIDQFREFVGCYDGRNSLSLKDFLGELIDDSGEIQFDSEAHTKRVEDVFAKIGRRQSPNLRKGITDEDAVRRLLCDCFFIDYIVKFNGDEIVQMSPGKRGLVLLNLILHLSNSIHPILIDQPEDNLDNRTVYDQLRGFLRKKKIERQIILVTHNANLVVATDAECIIVANQDGQNGGSGNAEYRFEFCSGGIEHSKEKDESIAGILYQRGIRQHICEVLEGGLEAFREREMKYGLKH